MGSIGMDRRLQGLEIENEERREWSMVSLVDITVYLNLYFFLVVCAHRLGQEKGLYIQVLTYSSISDGIQRVAHGSERYLSKSDAVGNKAYCIAQTRGLPRRNHDSDLREKC